MFSVSSNKTNNNNNINYSNNGMSGTSKVRAGSIGEGKRIGSLSAAHSYIKVAKEVDWR